MNTIQNLFQQAQLAEAAYADFSDPRGSYNALITNGFSDAQAAAFVAEWSVVSQQPDTVNGFSATLFKNNYTGQHSLAIRGSTPVQGLRDFIHDTKLISSDGIAVSQVVDLYNYWQSLNHTGAYGVAKLTTMAYESAILTMFGGTWATIPQSALEYILGVGIPYDPLSAPSDVARAFFTAAGYVVDSGMVYKVEADVSTNLYTDPADPRRTGTVVPGLTSVSVDGHSLGGHLAMAFSRLFPSATNSVTAVNGLGFKIGDANVDGLFSALSQLSSSANGGAATFDAGKIQNIYGIAGAEFAAMNNGVLQQPGGWNGIYIESITLPLNVGLGHGAGQMTDSLAMYNLLANLDPSLIDASPTNLATITNILKASSNTANRSLENTLDAVRKILDPNATTPTLTDDRENFYKNLYATGAANSCFAYTVRDLSGFPAAEIASVAETDIAYRYALKELNPFVLIGANYPSDGSLDIYNPADGKGALSREWLQDRAALLEIYLDNNIADGGNTVTPGFNFSGSTYYEDAATGFKVDPYIARDKVYFASDLGNTFTGGGGDDRLYGGAGIDTFDGGDGKDRLEGGRGEDKLTGGLEADTFIGGKDADILYGGAGSDTYNYTTGDGSDTIYDYNGDGYDGDGKGRIQYDGTGLSGGIGGDTEGEVKKATAGGTFKSSDDKYTYTWGGEGSDLTVNGNITVKNFHNGDLGITLHTRQKNPPAPIPDSVADAINRARTAVQRFGDPLTLDLNGNGIETVPLKRPPLLFDINANGIKISTGWIAPSDGLLVLDRNGNGVVDSGAELFGDRTPAYGSAGTTADGFAALAQEDSNHDGMVNAQDANWANLRVWQDLNQDGLSQPDELTTLESQGIASFNTARTAHSQMLPSGNQMADLGTFTRTDGSTGATGAPQGMADINLALDTFHRTFVDSIPLTVEAQALPDMQGSGKVRDMREAASLQTAAGQAFATALANFSAATTREDQLAQLDNLISAWADTSGFGTLQERAAAHGYTFTIALNADWQRKLTTLEAFNGQGYFRMPWEGASFGGSARQGLTVGYGGDPKAMLGQFWGAQLNPLGQAYDALRDSIYQALLPQTRLKPYLDAVRYSVDASGLQVDFSAVQTAFANTLASNPDKALGDLLEFNRYGKTLFQGTSWETQGWEELGAMLNSVTITPAIQKTLSDFNIGLDGHPELTVSTGKAQVLVAADAGSTLSGAGYDDVLVGGAGSDTLDGGWGVDTLHGGALIYRMNDTLVASGNVQRLFENVSNSIPDTMEMLVAANDTEGRMVA